MMCIVCVSDQPVQGECPHAGGRGTVGADSGHHQPLPPQPGDHAGQSRQLINWPSCDVTTWARIWSDDVIVQVAYGCHYVITTVPYVALSHHIRRWCMLINVVNSIEICCIKLRLYSVPIVFFLEELPSLRVA